MPNDRHRLDGPISQDVAEAFDRVQILRAEFDEVRAALPHLHRTYERLKSRAEALPGLIEAARVAANDTLSRARAGLIRTPNEEG
jgi:hypothetical protein